MKRVILAANGSEFSRMVYGTWRLLALSPGLRDRLEIVTKAGI